MKSNKKLLFISILTIAIVLIISLFPKNKGFFDKKETEQVININKIDKTKPVLRVAVAAMLSPKSTRKYYDDLLTLICAKSGYSTEIIQRQTYREINELLEVNALDIAFVCSGPYVEGNKRFGMKILAVPVVHGEKTYRSYILVNIKSPIKSFKELRGKKFAFVDPNSNTGYIVPKYMLAKINETPKSYFKETYYTYSHDKSIEAIADNLADGCAIDGIIWEYLNNTDPKITSKTKIIKKSEPYGIPPIVINASVNPEIEKKLRSLFLTIHEDSEGKKILSELQIDRFEEGHDSMYISVKKMQDWIDKQKNE